MEEESTVFVWTLMHNEELRDVVNVINGMYREMIGLAMKTLDN